MAASITENEIRGQPDLWLKVNRHLLADQVRIQNFIKPLLEQPNLEVILMGAGSSAFVGEMAALEWGRSWRRPVRAVATTDLVTHPWSYVVPGRQQLFVSYARSGHSPESVAAVDLIQHNPTAHQILLTCNRNGALAGRTLPNCLTVVLPDETNDQGLAMTGSVSSLWLASILISDRTGLGTEVAEAAEAGRTVLLQYSSQLQSLAARPFDRIVCLGSGPLLGLAREAHLKVQELSDGAVIGKWDSYLGFRHGPRVVVNSQTLVVYFFSSDPYVLQYELDLARSVLEQRPLATMGVSSVPVDVKLDLNISVGPLGRCLTLPYLLVPQLLGLYKSENLGLNPDSPSRNGAIHRVVQGVKIYPWAPGPL